LPVNKRTGVEILYFADIKAAASRLSIKQ